MSAVVVVGFIRESTNKNPVKRSAAVIIFLWIASVGTKNGQPNLPTFASCAARTAAAEADLPA